MSKKRLVMIGNGMAGLRTIEEILEREKNKSVDFLNKSIN